MDWLHHLLLRAFPHLHQQECDVKLQREERAELAAEQKRQLAELDTARQQYLRVHEQHLGRKYSQ